MSNFATLFCNLICGFTERFSGFGSNCISRPISALLSHKNVDAPVCESTQGHFKTVFKVYSKGTVSQDFRPPFYPLGLKDTQMVKETKNCINVRPSVLKSRDIFFWAPGQR